MEPNNAQNKVVASNLPGIPNVKSPNSIPCASEAEKAEKFWEGKLVAASFGNIVNLFLRSPAHRSYTVADFEWALTPPLALNQFIIAESTLENGQTVPAGVIFFASVSKEVDARLSSAPRYPIRLHPNEWNSGDVFWIIDIIGEPDTVEVMLNELDRLVFKGKPFKMLSLGDDGQKTTIEGRR